MDFIPLPVTSSGFTSAAAIIVTIGQITNSSPLHIWSHQQLTTPHMGSPTAHLQYEVTNSSPLHIWSHQQLTTPHMESPTAHHSTYGVTNSSPLHIWSHQQLTTPHMESPTAHHSNHMLKYNFSKKVSFGICYHKSINRCKGCQLVP